MRLSRESKFTLLIGFIGVLVLLSAKSDGATILGRYSLRYLAVVLAYTVGVAATAFALSRPMPRLPASLWLGAAALAFVVISQLTLLDHTWWLNTTLKLSLNWLVVAVLLRADANVRYWRALLVVTGCVI